MLILSLQSLQKRPEVPTVSDNTYYLLNVVITHMLFSLLFLTAIEIRKVLS